MWLHVCTIAIFILALTEKTRAISRRENKRQKPELHELILQSTSAIEHCETIWKGTHAGQTEAVISCKPHNNVLAMTMMQTQRRQRFFFVTVLNKNEWQTCETLRCSVTHVSTFVDGRDCTAVKKKKIKRKRKSRVTHKIALKEIKYIAASSRDSDIIIGIGPGIARILLLLSFNTTDDFVVRQHLFFQKIKAATTAGLTTGPCYTGQGVCVYICCLQYLQYKIVVFKEPDDYTDQVQHMKDKYADLSVRKGSIISIAVDANCTLYVLEFSTTKTKIRIIHLSDSGNDIIHMRVVTVLWSLLKPTSLDITREGDQLLLAINNKLYLLSLDTFSGKTNIHYNNLQNINQDKHEEELVRFLRNGKSIAFINSMFPYKARKRPLFPN